MEASFGDALCSQGEDLTPSIHQASSDTLLAWAGQGFHSYVARELCVLRAPVRWAEPKNRRSSEYRSDAQS